MAEYVVTAVPADKAGDVWPRIEKNLARAMRVFDLYSTEDVRGFVTEGQWLLWIAVTPGRLEAFGLTEIQQFPRRRVMVLHGSGGGGGLKAINAIWPHVVAAAKDAGCSRIITDARRGWLRGGSLPKEFKHVADSAMAEV